MTEPEILAAIEAAKSGDATAYGRLHEQFTGFIWLFVRKIEVRGMDEEDRYNESWLSAVRAIQGYDPAHGVKFITYLGSAIKRNLWSLRWRHRAGLITLPRFKTAPIAWDAPQFKAQKLPLNAENVPDTSEPTLREIDRIDTAEQVRDAMAKVLTERERQAVEGFMDGATLEETGLAFESPVTRERVRQIRERAFAKLRRELEGVC